MDVRLRRYSVFLIQALCGDGAMEVKKVAAKKAPKNRSARLLLGTLGASSRKRKASDDEGSDEGAETEEDSTSDIDNPGSESDGDDDDEEVLPEDIEPSTPKKIRICNKNVSVFHRHCCTSFVLICTFSVGLDDLGS